MYFFGVNKLLVPKNIKSIYIKRGKTPGILNTADPAFVSDDFQYGARFVSYKGNGTVIGKKGDELWVQLDQDNGKVSFWDDIHDRKDIASRGIHLTGELVTPQYLSYYELETLVNHCNEYSSYSCKNGFSFPRFQSIFKHIMNEARIAKYTNSDGFDFISLMSSDLITEICDFCKPLEIFSALLVSKKWRELFSHHQIWKNYCRRYNIAVNDVILRDDYNNDYIQYFFSYGIPRTHKFFVDSRCKFDELNNTTIKVGDLHWHLDSRNDKLRIHMKESTLKFLVFEEISVSFETAIVDTIQDTSRTKISNVKICHFKSSYKVFSYKSDHIIVCEMRVKISPTLLSLIYSRTIRV